LCTFPFSFTVAFFQVEEITVNKIMKNYAEWRKKSFSLSRETKSEQQMDFLLLFKCFFFSPFLCASSVKEGTQQVKFFLLCVFFGFAALWVFFPIRSRWKGKERRLLLLDDSILFRLFMVKYSWCFVFVLTSVFSHKQKQLLLCLWC
jgi:hypothetical protein